MTIVPAVHVAMILRVASVKNVKILTAANALYAANVSASNARKKTTVTAGCAVDVKSV